MMTVFLYLLLAHVLSDFYCQSDRFCRVKNEKGFCSWHLYVHALVVFLLTMLCVPSPCMLLGAVVITLTHLLLDGLKRYCRSSDYFVTDQILHVSILFGVAVWCRDCDVLWLQWVEMKWFIVVLGLLLCLKPSNIWIREIFRMFRIAIPNTEDNASFHELPNAGRLIGGIERLLTYTLVLLGQFEAIGFLIAAKSILRFRENDTAKTEYVLVGTLLSFAIAILVGLLVNWMIGYGYRLS